MHFGEQPSVRARLWRPPRDAAQSSAPRAAPAPAPGGGEGGGVRAHAQGVDTRPASARDPPARPRSWAAAPGSTPRCARAGPASCGRTSAAGAPPCARRGRHAARTRRRRGTPRASSPRRTKAAASSSTCSSPRPAASQRGGLEFDDLAPERLSALEEAFELQASTRSAASVAFAAQQGDVLGEVAAAVPVEQAGQTAVNPPRWPASSVT